MIAEIAAIAALSGTAIGYMIGKAGKAAIERSRDRWVLRAEDYLIQWTSLERQLKAIRRARSAAVAKGNTTRRLKREAEKVSA